MFLIGNFIRVSEVSQIRITTRPECMSFDRVCFVSGISHLSGTCIWTRSGSQMSAATKNAGSLAELDFGLILTCFTVPG